MEQNEKKTEQTDEEIAAEFEKKLKEDLDGKSEKSDENNDKSDKKDKEQKKEDKKADKKELAALTERVAVLEKELADAKDRYLRTAAEYDNFRRRSAKEREGVYTDAVTDVIKQILPIADNLDRAAASGGDGEKVAEGLRLTMNTLRDCLEKLGVSTFGAPGDTFDPNLHNAIMHEENPDKGEGEIVEVFQPGCRRGDKIIRYAMVKVAN